MKRIFCLSLLLVLCMTGCLPAVSGKIELHQKGWILHREQTISLSGTETEAIMKQRKHSRRKPGWCSPPAARGL